MFKDNKGFTQTDIVISIIAVMLFTTIILSVMINVKNSNAKLKAKSIANIYMTEILENIGIAQYEDITEENKSKFIPEMTKAFETQINVTKVSDEDSKKEDEIKKVEVKITYKIGNKTYEENAKRLKVKE